MASKQLKGVEQNGMIFTTEMRLITRSDDIAAMLPTVIQPKVSACGAAIYEQTVSNWNECRRSSASGYAAVHLLDCGHAIQNCLRSLFGEITKAASDGLLPDGREGVIQSYNTKVKYRDKDGKDRDRWEKTAVWMPMSHGMRKRANELESILVDAQVVYVRVTNSFGYRVTILRSSTPARPAWDSARRRHRCLCHFQRQ